MFVWGLDPGQDFGIAVADAEYIRNWRPRLLFGQQQEPRPGLLYCQTRRFDEPGEYYGLQLTRTAEALEELWREYPPVMVATEKCSGHWKSQAAMLSTVGSHSIVAAWCAKRQVRLRRFVRQQIKKLATGSGGSKIDKPAMLAAAHRAGFPCRTHNDADAAWALEYLLHQEWCRRNNQQLEAPDVSKRKPRPRSRAAG